MTLEEIKAAEEFLAELKKKKTAINEESNTEGKEISSRRSRVVVQSRLLKTDRVVVCHSCGQAIGINEQEVKK